MDKICTVHLTYLFAALLSLVCLGMCWDLGRDLGLALDSGVASMWVLASCLSRLEAGEAVAGEDRPESEAEPRT